MWVESGCWVFAEVPARVGILRLSRQQTPSPEGTSEVPVNSTVSVAVEPGAYQVVDAVEGDAEPREGRDRVVALGHDDRERLAGPWRPSW